MSNYTLRERVALGLAWTVAKLGILARELGAEVDDSIADPIVTWLVGLAHLESEDFSAFIAERNHDWVSAEEYWREGCAIRAERARHAS